MMGCGFQDIFLTNGLLVARYLTGFATSVPNGSFAGVGSSLEFVSMDGHRTMFVLVENTMITMVG